MVSFMWGDSNINKLKSKVKGNKKQGERSIAKGKKTKRWREEEWKRIKMPRAHGPVPHKQRGHHVQQTQIEKIRQWNPLMKSHWVRSQRSTFLCCTRIPGPSLISVLSPFWLYNTRTSTLAEQKDRNATQHTTFGKLNQRKLKNTCNSPTALKRSEAPDGPDVSKCLYTGRYTHKHAPR